MLCESYIWVQQSHRVFWKCSTLLIFEIGGELCQCWAVYKPLPNLPIHKNRCWPCYRWLTWGRIHPYNVWQRCHRKRDPQGWSFTAKGYFMCISTGQLVFQVTVSVIVWLLNCSPYVNSLWIWVLLQLQSSYCKIPGLGAFHAEKKCHFSSPLARTLIF